MSVNQGVVWAVGSGSGTSLWLSVLQEQTGTTECVLVVNVYSGAQGPLLNLLHVTVIFNREEKQPNPQTEDQCCNKLELSFNT